MPYFSEWRGAKWNGFIRLSILYRLSITSQRTEVDQDDFGKSSITIQTQIDIIYLLYHLSDASHAKYLFKIK